MIRVRHGLMVVGYPFAGKTSALKILQGTLTQMQAEGLGNPVEMKTHIIQLNPKSVTMG